MATQVQRRRGNTAQHAAFIGAVGETTYDSDIKRLVAHDGLTAGGLPAAHLHVANIFSQPQTIAVAPGAPVNAFDIQVDGVTRFAARKTGFVVVHRQEADTSPASFELTKRGTTGNALAALSSGSGIGAMFFRGYDGTAFGDAASIRSFATEAWAPGAHGTSLTFGTVPIGGTVDTIQATLNSTGFTLTNRLLLPNTTSATVGGIYFGGSRAFHNFGTSNIFGGVNAGNLTLTGTSNAAFGVLAGTAITSGTNNAFFGRSAGAANTTALNNSFFGSYAGAANTTASYNAFFGAAAGFVNITGTNNAFFGAGSGQANTASNNAFFGRLAGRFNTSGTSNSFFGRSAGTANTTGSQNSFFGFDAGRTNTTGNYNSFFGLNAGVYNTTGTKNSFFGLSAGFSNTTGQYNCFFGLNAGRLNTTGNNNTLLGYQAGNNLTTGSNNIVLGFDIDTPTATNSNTLTIGNLIFGTGIDGIGLAISSGNIGIAVITPHSGLHLGRSFAAPYRATAVTTTFLSSDYTIDANGTFTVNLPTAVGITGRIYVVKNSGVGTITLDPAGAELIDGLATATVVAGASITTQSTGAGWIII